MSEKEVYAFMEQCRNDKLLGEEVRRLSNEGGKEDALVKIAAREGFTFTTGEFTAAVKKGRGKATSQTQELSDEALDQVSGGAKKSCKGCLDKGPIYCWLVCLLFVWD